MVKTIKFKRGNSTGLGAITLEAGEPAFTIDTGKLYIGNGTDKVLINPDLAANAETATKLEFARTITLSGDVTGSVSFDGSTNVTINTTESNSGITPGTYTKLTIDSKGKATAGNSLSAADIPTLTASKISDFDTQVKTITLDKMSIPTADLNLNNNKITNLGTPINGTDAVNKNYVDAARSGLSVKDPVRVATTANLSATYASNILTSSVNEAIIIDGVTLKLNDRILVKDQATGSQNGIYFVSQLGDASNPWKLTRTTDANTADDIIAGMATWINEGTINGDGRWVLTTNNPITLDTTSLTFTKDFQGSDIVAGTGINKSGNTLSLSTSGVTSGTYKSVTVDTYGRVTGGTNPTTLSGYGITDGINTNDVVTIATPNKILKLDSTGFLPTSVTGNAATADKFKTARTITLSGDVAGSVSFDGSANVTINTTIDVIDGGTF